MAKHSIAGICGANIPDLDDLPQGKIIGVVNLTNCVTESISPWFFGRYGFVMEAATTLSTLIPASGALGLWDVSSEIEDAIKDQIKGD